MTPLTRQIKNEIDLVLDALIQQPRRS